MHKTTGTTSDDAQAEVRTEMNKLPDDADTQGPRFEKLPTEAVVKRPTAETAALLDVDGVAGLLACSPRHVYRLADSGKMPRPVKLGALSRWSRMIVLAWIAEGCPAINTARRSGGAA